MVRASKVRVLGRRLVFQTHLRCREHLSVCISFINALWMLNQSVGWDRECSISLSMANRLSSLLYELSAYEF